MKQHKIKRLLDGYEVEDDYLTYLYLPKTKTVMQSCVIGCCNDEMHIDEFLLHHEGMRESPKTQD